MIRRGAGAGRWLSALLVAAAVVSAPGPAQAAPARQAPCRAAGVVADDRALAEQLRPSMTGKRLGRAVSGSSIACARAIVSAVQARGLNRRAAVIAVTTAIAESTLNNHTVALDHDSLGLFQQRPSQGWGRPDQLVDPTYATNAFLSSMVRKYPDGSWQTGDVGAISQAVQRSAFPRAYSPEALDAELIVAALWGTAESAPVPSASAKPTGPLQKALITAATVLGPIATRNELALTDWNGDGKPDLALVNGSGTVTGKTEVRIMDGATNFAALILTTATALGPTDERFDYAFADWNGDKRPDLFVTQRSGAASGRTEVQILDGASGFQQILLEPTAVLAATDERFRFAAADWNGDDRLDLVVTQTSGTGTGKMEVQVLDGAATFQKHLMPATATPETAGTGHPVVVTDYDNDRHPDLVVLQKSATAAGRTQVRVFDGEKQLRRQLSKTDSVAGVTTHLDLLITDWNGDKRPDLMMVQKAATADTRTEMVIFGG
ncbi:VCBS repeat-containing protein [Actinoplanes sp. OR16]|uniref:FG-GAP repeat domain-containing protein n=1 Tax=Actinoplanes sp. OR16 TaxID=946334 RepID=UPI000FD947FB|nr:VCBS repeat-containing protein [Actinoplanes sp. OR16]